MTYTQLGLLAVAVAVGVDLWILRTRLVKRRIFWKSYAIIISFQLLTNGILTGYRIVRYNGDYIMGSNTPSDSAPSFLGDGRIAFAPVEDLFFGFSLVLLTLVLWVWLGRVGVGRSPVAGPPRPFMRRLTK
jgi:lycopene cyclase domain-containing protein